MPTLGGASSCIYPPADPRRRILLLPIKLLHPPCCRSSLGLRSDQSSLEFSVLIVVLHVPWVEGILGFGVHLIVSRSLSIFDPSSNIATGLCFADKLNLIIHLNYLFGQHNCHEISPIFVIQLGSFPHWFNYIFGGTKLFLVLLYSP
jgi:hypothetical protein